MFAVAVELLSGRYVASAYNDRERVEWPPHPARLFSALVAAWADGEPHDPSGIREADALRWLEQQPAPEIFASPLGAAGSRDVVPVFVPVNDVSLVMSPNREKLDEAEGAFEAAIAPKEKARAEKAVRKLEQKLAAETIKAVGVPAKFGKTDAASAEKLISDRRSRQPRSFPSAAPECPTFAFVWPEAEPPSHILNELARMLSRLVRLGHSSSFVRASILDERALYQLVPRVVRYAPDDEGGQLSIRWVGVGQLDKLVRAFDLHRETEPRVLPARFVRYREGDRTKDEKVPGSIFADDFVVLSRTGGPRLPITSVVGIGRQLRRALMSFADEPIHEMLSGHKAAGEPSDTPHLAIVPFPVVLGPHADGAVVGVGLVLPRDTEDRARLAVLRALGRFEQHARRDPGEDAPIISLHLGEAGELELQRVAWGEDRRSTLKPGTWCGPSKRWASATPVALDRNPGDLHQADPEKRRAAFVDATAIVIEAVQRIGLPAPLEVDVLRSCVLPGTAKPRSYPRFPIDQRRPQRVLVHVRLVFGETIRGPVLIGAGRYHGLGLCLPVDGRGEETV
jgi:CRISPR-associated protein Csb2